MAKYSPDENVTMYTVSEWFDYLDEWPDNHSKTTHVEYDPNETAHIHEIISSSGAVMAKIGYRAPCIWAPIFSCDTDVGISKYVNTDDSNHIDFIGYTQEDNDWVTAYYKMSPSVLWKTYKGSAPFLLEEPGKKPIEGVSKFREYASYPGIVFQVFMQTLGSNCSWEPVSENTRISMTINLLSVS